MSFFEDLHATRLALEAIAEHLKTLSVSAACIAANLKILTDAASGKVVGITVEPGPPMPSPPHN